MERQTDGRHRQNTIFKGRKEKPQEMETFQVGDEIQSTKRRCKTLGKQGCKSQGEGTAAST